MINIAFLASHNGSSARAITDACLSGILPAEPKLLISNNPDSKALEWARAAKLQTAVINAGNSNNPDATIANLLADNNIDLVICSGYMKLIGPQTITASHGAILNVHPALLPRHGGKGKYGRHVHQAVFDNKETETGITIHLVDGEYDRGRIVAQKTIPVLPTDSVDDIENNVKMAEPEFYIETLRAIFTGVITL
jgi:phosphoribosylglycinamide formyltransferase-1